MTGERAAAAASTSQEDSWGTAERYARRGYALLHDPQSRLGRAVLAVLGSAGRLEPSRTALRRRLQHTPPAEIVVTCAYRIRNADLVLAMIEGDPDVTWLLWAVDEVDPRLATHTLGQGRGPKLRLHQDLLDQATLQRAAASDAPRPFWALADDDLTLAPATFADLARTAAMTGLDVFAPSHTWDSNVSHAITVKRPLSLVRLTHFVEIGPILVLSSRAQDVLLPFPADRSGDWGLEAYWSSLYRPELRCGLVDALTMNHLVPVGRGYDIAAAWESAQEWVRGLGVEDLDDHQRAMSVTLRTWRPWQARAPW